MTRASLALAHPPALMSAEHAAAYLSVSVSTLRTAPGMPRPRQITPGRVAWLRPELDAWAASLPTVGEEAQARAAEAGRTQCDEVFG
jgi:predicted DNA-binding transcriptional regulator AlpA